MKSMHMTEDTDDESEIIQQLKVKFHETHEKSVKVQILTLSNEEHQKMNLRLLITWYERLKAKAFVKLEGILSTPNPNHGHG